MSGYARGMHRGTCNYHLVQEFLFRFEDGIFEWMLLGGGDDEAIWEIRELVPVLYLFIEISVLYARSFV